MKFNFQALALAAAAVAAGGAQAAMSTMASGSSSLAFVAYDNTGAARSSFMADLNFSIDQFLPTTALAQTQTITWNFNTNVITVGGVVQTGTTIDWSPFTQFANAANTQTSELRWGVIAGDLVNQRFLTTGNATTANLADTGTQAQAGTTSNMVNVDNMYLTNNALVAGTHDTASAGASTSLSTGDAHYVARASNLGTAGNWNNALRWSAGTANAGVSRFFYIDTQSRNAALNPDLPTIRIFGIGDMQAPAVIPTGPIDQMTYSTFSFDQGTGVLTYVAAVPEPGTYAMLLAGLAAVGFVARRRRTG